MSLEKQINEDIKACMLARDKDTLEALRAVKAAILLEKSAKGNPSDTLTEEVELKLLQKLVKQRKESAEVYRQKNRLDLENVELFQAQVIEKYLPSQMGKEELTEKIKGIIVECGAKDARDMGKVMGIATKQFAGKADNKIVSEIVKLLLST
ncbi:MAG: GatB/YqeY domain-containing protein [Lentimicrobiaceae bacterium]|nr:GatB/YqeY domain-containing protein [Lentimicrobiaceae bacterium]